MLSIKQLYSVLALSLAATAPVSYADEWQHSVGLSLGQTHIDDASWAGQNNFGSFAINYEMHNATWPVSLTASLYGAGDERNQNNVEATDVLGGLQIGVKKYWQLNASQWQPYVSGGINFATAEKSTKTGSTTIKQSKNRTSYYLGAGLLWNITGSFEAGIDLRYTHVDVTLFDEKVKAGGLFTGISLGYRF